LAGTDDGLRSLFFMRVTAPYRIFVRAAL